MTVGSSNSIDKINKYNKLVVLCTMLYPILAVVRKIDLADMASKAIMFVLLASIVLLFLRERVQREDWLAVLCAVILGILAFLYPISQDESISTVLMYPVWIVYLIYLSVNSDIVVTIMRQYKSTVLMLVMVWEAIVAISFAFPSSYETTWGDGRYFTSFSNTSFEVSPAATLIIAVIILLYVMNGDLVKTLLLMGLPLYTVFASGTRTYLVVAVLEMLLFARLIINSKSVYALFVAVLMVVVVVAVQHTNIGSKFAEAFSYIGNDQAFWAVFTNGRNSFWQVDLNAYYSGNIIQKLFGFGYSYVYELNEASFGVRIYAHNDFINILLNYGLLGLALYLYAIIRVSRTLLHGCSKYMILIVISVWLFNAVFNMVYVYMSAVFGLCVLMLAVSIAKQSNRNTCKVADPV